MNDIIISTWGIGPSYRKRVITHINKCIDSGYDKIIPYIILTDNPDDFKELAKNKKIVKKVINIHKERNKYSKWSEKYEFLSKFNDEYRYGKENREKSLNGWDTFSYGLHRFSWPTICKLGYTKFIHCDPDFEIRYDKIISGEIPEKQFWEEFNTPINSMKGVVLEEFNLKGTKEDIWSDFNVILYCILKYRLNDIFNLPPIQVYLPFFIQTEGPFRFYNLSSTDKIMECFKMVDKGIELVLKEPFFREHQRPQPYAYLDNVVHAAVNNLLDIKMLDFPPIIFTPNIYLEDRYFLPNGSEWVINGEKMFIESGTNIEDFIKKNKKIIDNSADAGLIG